jgi:hypothetical protein
MLSMARVLLIFFTVGGLVLAGTLVRPDWLAGLGMDPQEFSDSLALLQREQLRGGHLDAVIRTIRGRLEAKERLVRALIAGDLALGEAAQRYRGCCRGLPPAPPLECGGRSEGERCCRYLLAWVREALARSHGTDRVVLTRLEAELREYQAAETKGGPYAWGGPPSRLGPPARRRGFDGGRFLASVAILLPASRGTHFPSGPSALTFLPPGQRHRTPPRARSAVWQGKLRRTAASRWPRGFRSPSWHGSCSGGAAAQVNNELGGESP